ncbi:MAG: CAP domain-containing protein [Thermoanaerobaculia bacterium]
MTFSRRFMAWICIAPLAFPAFAVTGSQPGLPPPLVDDFAVTMRALGVDDEEPAEVDLSPDAPPAATLEEQIVELVNQERANCSGSGCPAPPLKLAPLLLAVADEHSGSMAVNEYFSHCDFSTGLDPFERMVQAGYSFLSAAENIAAGNSTAAATMAQWMASSGHRANILAVGFREIGAGYFRQIGDLANVRIDRNNDCDCTDASETCSSGGLTYYWTQVFGARPGVYPVIINDEAHQTASGAVTLYVHATTGADDMRFSNDGRSWSAWQSFANQASWALAGGSGLRTVFVEWRDGATVRRACDRIWRTGAGGTELFVDGFDCDAAAAWSAIEP